MRLADFISQHREPILLEWDAFAKLCGPVGGAMNQVALRDHAAVMLDEIIDDLNTSQSPGEQEAKSKGASAPDGSVPDTAAEVHAAGRAASGFTMSEMVAEYRALRASVLRLWTAETGTLTGTDLRDLTRFNEAIDQALAESVARFGQDLDRSREMFVAILGHDLRNPLNTILMGTKLLLEIGAVAQAHATLAERIVRSAQRMNVMTAELLDFARSRLGAGIPILRQPTDLAQEAAHAIEETRVAHPSHPIALETSGDVHGEWDGARLRQLFSNLLGNAVQYGAKDSLIRVTLLGAVDEATLAVHNTGTPIPSAQLPQLFDPFKRIATPGAEPQNATGLGLGLYIAQQVVHAHGGTIGVVSSESAGTVFTVSLPRQGADRAEPAVTTPDAERLVVPGLVGAP